MYKGKPFCNKICEAERIRKENELLYKKITTAKANVNNKSPPKQIHLNQRLKQCQLVEERNSVIQRDNTILLAKMSGVFSLRIYILYQKLGLE
jgi:hypothetical protein